MNLKEIDEVVDEARQRLRAELILSLVVLSIFVVGLIEIYRYLDGQCWFHWFGDGPVQVRERYYQLESDPKQIPVALGALIPVPDKSIQFGIKLSLKKQCYGSDIVGEVHNYAAGQTRWVEAEQGGGELLPQKGDITTLSGSWIRPPPGQRYLIEIRLVRKSHPGETLFVSSFATFDLKEDR